MSEWDFVLLASLATDVHQCSPPVLGVAAIIGSRHLISTTVNISVEVENVAHPSRPIRLNNCVSVYVLLAVPFLEKQKCYF